MGKHLKPYCAHFLKYRDFSYSMVHDYLLEKAAPPNNRGAFSKSVFGHIKQTGKLLVSFSYIGFLAEQQFPFSTQTRPLVSMAVEENLGLDGMGEHM